MRYFCASIIIYEPMKKSSKREDRVLEEARIAIEGALKNAEVLSRLEQHGYDTTRLLQGKAIIDEIKVLSSAGSEALGSQKGATHDINEHKAQVNGVYKDHVALARVALKNRPDMLELLQLNGPRKKDLIGWMEQTMAFYGNAHRVEKELKKVGIVPEQWQQMKASVEAIADARIRQNTCKANAQYATSRRKTLLKQLNDFMVDYRYISRYVFKQDPQKLETLGIIVKE